MTYQPNPGHLPDECVILDPETGEVAGYRAVHVRLFGSAMQAGIDTKRRGDPPWPAKGGRPLDTNWRVSSPPHPYQIKEFEVQ